MSPWKARLREQFRLFHQGLGVGGRDVYASTRASVRSVEAQTGAALFFLLGLVGIFQAGAWPVDRSAEGLVLDAALRWHPGLRGGMAALLLALHAGVGVLGGVFFQNAWQAVGTVVPSLRPGRWPLRWRAGVTAFALLFFHGVILLRDGARHPAAYRGFLFGADGAPALFTRLFSPALPLCQGLLGLALLLAFLHLVRRLAVGFLGFARPTRVAVAVLGAFVGLSALGFWAVRRAQARPNTGPNLLVLAIDGGRGQDFDGTGGGASPLARLTGSARRFRQCVPPTADPDGIWMTFLTGETPPVHGVRHAFPAAAATVLGPDALPGVLRAAGYHTAVLSDAGADLLARRAADFDEGRAAPATTRGVLIRRTLERSVHLLPYLSGAWGRALFPPLRGSPALADPRLLAEEAVDRLRDFRFRPKFFLLVHWSALAHPAGPRPAARAALDGAVGRVLKALADNGLAESTLIALWSPRGVAATPAEAAAAEALDGPVFFDAPFALVEPHLRSGARRMPGAIRTQDLAPTLLDVLGLPVPAAMEGLPRLGAVPWPAEAAPLYAEGASFSSPLFGLPPVDRLLVEDRDAPGRLRLDPAWEDRVVIGKRRMIQVGPERLVYLPTANGVRFSYFRSDQAPGVDLAGARAWAPRVKDMRDLFYRHLAREPGWRPQNDYWLPEAFLREEPENP